MKSLTSALFAALLFAAGLFGPAGQVQANNIPGSAGAALPELSRTATNIIVRDIKRDVVQMRGAGPSATVSRDANAQVLSFAATGGGATATALSLGLRGIDNTRLDGTIATSSILLGGYPSQRTMVFGGLIGERVDVDTTYNAGTVESTGYGLALGADYAVSDRLGLTGIIGVLTLDYDVSRNFGATTGSFGADRTFIELNGDYLARAGAADLRFSGGLLYMEQRNKGYTESTGAVIAPFTEDQLTANLGLRAEWGRAGGIRPYVEGHSWFTLSENNNAAAPILGLTDTSDWTGRLGLGIARDNANTSLDFGLGANFGEDGFEGPDAHIRYSIRF